MLERDVSAALNETEARYRPLRVLGGLVLLVGLVCFEPRDVRLPDGTRAKQRPARVKTLAVGGVGMYGAPEGVTVTQLA